MNKKLHHFIGDFDLLKSELLIQDPEIRHQIRRVLKLKVGEQIVLSDGRSSEATAVIEAISDEGVQVSLGQATSGVSLDQPNIELALALIKPGLFELAVQKATEIGINRIIPMTTERTVRIGFKQERLEKIIKEAAEQSEQVRLPELATPINFKEALEFSGDKILFDKSGAAFQKPASGAVRIFIGPEGGFTDAELALAKSHHCQIVNLGKGVLRAETAAIISSYLVKSELS
ncbi:MAG: RsmE family RNA methyltransferase [bacterium]